MEYNHVARAALNPSMGMRAKPAKKAKPSLEGNVGVVSQGMVNPEVQNDDVLDPTKLMGM
jgi:hypothetical protein